MPGTRQAVAGSRHTLYIRLLHSGKFSLHNPVSDPGLRNTRLHFMVTYQFVICYGRFQVIKATRIVSIQPPGQFYDMRGYQETAVNLLPEHFGHGYRCLKSIPCIGPPEGFVEQHKPMVTFINLLQHLFHPEYFRIKMTAPIP